MVKYDKSGLVLAEGARMRLRTPHQHWLLLLQKKKPEYRELSIKEIADLELSARLLEQVKKINDGYSGILSRWISIALDFLDGRPFII